ncbi:hypothetical protein Taro_052098 [Colocasia esculenta]|uniref:S-acyltransferase n=1 Tax=Colocasia esculenta TaxID=4460 RepID=A0A843XJ78_COLES|nr:hypothetical protein [Colocasia esculenta]
MERPEPEPEAKRLYRVWKGSNRFFCGGRLIFGPDVASLYLSTLLIAGPAFTFCSQVISKIVDREKPHYVRDPDQTNILGLPVLIVAAVVTISDLLFLFLTSSRDPGILPRNTRPPESEELFDISTPSMEWINGRTPHLRLPRTKEVVVNGFIVKVKFCDTCLLYRPPRASHCSICNNCVQRFDHHCPWVGQCIGLRNYRFFFLFISSSTFLCMYIFIFSWLNIVGQKDHYGSIWRSMSGEVLSLILIVYTFIAVWFVGGLTVFHSYLICTNQTTYENFRYRYDKKENPYNKGILRNLRDLFFSRIPLSLNNFRSWVLEESVEVLPFSPSMGIDIISPLEKIDIEMGNKLAISGGMPVTGLLQDLDFGDLHHDLKKDRHDDAALELFTFSANQEPDIGQTNDRSKASVTQETAATQCNVEKDGIHADQRDVEGNNSNGTVSVLPDNDTHDLHR